MTQLKPLRRARPKSRLQATILSEVGQMASAFDRTRLMWAAQRSWLTGRIKEQADIGTSFESQVRLCLANYLSFRQELGQMDLKFTRLVVAPPDKLLTVSC